MRVVATAGHVDHGKSSLVRALTGTDPDRFPEEHVRGLTIDLGFAFCTLASGTDVGFVDVPGHVRFIKNMLAGVGAVEVAVLVVAANEGWMPQSEEHVRILDLLGVRHGLVALTKADLVDAETVEHRALEVAAALEGTTFETAPIVACDSRSGRGLDDVRRALDDVLAHSPEARDIGRPRLWIDRVFSAKGAGTVVTGTLTGGSVAVDDELLAGGHPVRVRALESNGRRIERAQPGVRLALNLAGVDHHALVRGDAIVRAGDWLDVTLVDAAVRPIAGIDRPRRGRLQAYVGSGEHAIWFRPLDNDRTLARLRFPEGLPLAPGDRIVLRDSGRSLTLAGAEVREVMPTGRASEAPARCLLPLSQRLLALGWLPVDTLAARSGLAPADALALVAAAGGVHVGTWMLAGEHLEALLERADQIVAEHHNENPDARGVPTTVLARALDIDAEQLRALLAHSQGLITDQGAVRRASHEGTASSSDAGRALLAALSSAPYAPPQPDDLALARALGREGVVVEQDGIYFSSDALERARDVAVDALRERGTLTVADLRDLLGSTRKYVVPIFRYLDAQGVTRRRGDERIPGPTSGLRSDERS